VGHFDGHGGAPVPYGAHHPMQHDQGFIGSHWMPPLGDYLLRIAPTAARATANETTIQHVPHFAGHFDGRGGNAVVLYRAHHPMEEVRGFHKNH